MVPLRQAADQAKAKTPARLEPAFHAPSGDARALQAMASAAFRRSPVKWSPRRTAVFIVVASSVLWAAIFALGSALLRGVI